jgi:acyl transferase domain-containing protein
VIVAAHTRARVPITSIGYVEIHGTGTPKGDPIEFQGLTQAFATLAERQGVKLPDAYCGLSALKTNIGHLEGAAGIASVIKVLLTFQHRTLPGMHGYSKLNPRITIEGTPFYVLDQTREWRQEDERLPRRAGISSFGFSGSNAHLVLEEPPRPKAARSRAKPPAAHLLALSAKTPAALLRAQINLLAWLREDGGATSLADVATTLLGGRSHFACRWACAASDAAELIGALEPRPRRPRPRLRRSW